MSASYPQDKYPWLKSTRQPMVVAAFGLVMVILAMWSFGTQE